MALSSQDARQVSTRSQLVTESVPHVHLTACPVPAVTPVPAKMDFTGRPKMQLTTVVQVSGINTLFS